MSHHTSAHAGYMCGEGCDHEPPADRATERPPAASPDVSLASSLRNIARRLRNGRGGDDQMRVASALLAEADALERKAVGGS